MIASIGPTTSGELRRYGLDPDLEASHPKLGFLVREAAEQASRILADKRAPSAGGAGGAGEASDKRAGKAGGAGRENP
jgi:hypothetical protein